MTEVELNVLFNICPERVDNICSVDSAKNQEEIRRIVKVFQIAKNQRKTSQKIAARSLAPFRDILTSNN